MHRIHNRNRRLNALLLAIFCIAAVSPAGHAYGVDGRRPLSQLRLDTWSVRDGLPSRVITSIAQTPDGFIWLGTAAGLIRFDGVSFDTYNTQNTPSLTNNNITALTVARDGTLWVGMDWGGFGRFIDGRYIPCIPPDKHWSHVYCIVQDTDGSMWVGAWGDTPVRHVVGGKIIGYTDLKTTDPGVSALLPLGNGSVLCGMPWDTPRILKPDGKIVKIWTNINFNYPCNGIIRARDGSIWYAVGRTGLYQIDGDKVRHFTVKNGLASNVVTAVYEDRYGQIWAGTSNGLSVWDGKSFQTFGKDDGLYDSVVGAILEDKEENVWVASGVGLNRFAATRLCPYTLTVGSNTATLANDALYPASSGGVWCVSNLGLWRLRTDSATRCVFVDKLASHFEGVAQGPDGHLWLWTDRGRETYTLWCLTPAGKNKTSFDALERPYRPGEFDCRQLTIHGAIFCAVARPGCLIAIGRDKARYIAPGQILRTISIPGKVEFAARQDPSGTIWVGDVGGLIRLRGERATVLDSGLPKDAHVLGIDATDPQCLWLATDHGLGRFQNGRSTMFGKAAGLPDDNLFEVMRDADGRLWIGSNYGIFTIRIRDIDDYAAGRRIRIPYESFQAADGIRSFPTVFSTAKSASGRLWFGGDKGVTMVNPRSTALNPIAPPVSIEAATVDGARLTVGGPNEIPPGSGLFFVRYAALSFAAPEKVLFRYKLEGLDKYWTDPTDRRVAMYPYLPPGHYRFVVIACNNDGIWNTQGQSISFVILPHYYQTAWFKLLCAAIIGLLLAVIYWLRVRAIMLRNRQLEDKVAERTGQLQVSNNQLKTAQETLEKQYGLLEDRNHELEVMHRELEEQNEELQAMQAELEEQNEELRAMQESLAEANAYLAALATTDGLTGLQNHRSFQEKLESEWERHRRYGSPLSLILLDIDEFKQYNDKFGHQAGDQVLKAIAELLRSEARDCDIVARYGGEEFVLILPETDRAGAVNLAERIRSSIAAKQWPLRSVTASFGVATADLGVKTGPDLFTLADSALFFSKEHGRNRAAHAAEIAAKSLRRVG